MLSTFQIRLRMAMVGSIVRSINRTHIFLVFLLNQDAGQRVEETVIMKPLQIRRLESLE